MTSIIKVGILSFTLLLSACVTGTRNVALEVPTVSSSKSGMGAVQIVSITDSRVFEQKPSNPKTPSSKTDIASLSDQTKATLIGRQRNGYGMAMGDISLEAGTTIQDEVTQLVGTGLQNLGYVLADDANIKLTIDIEKFWGWMVPSFMTTGFESEVATKLSVTKNGNTKTVTVEGFGNNEGQIASNANWQLTFSRAFENYLSNMENAAAELGL